MSNELYKSTNTAKDERIAELEAENNRLSSESIEFVIFVLNSVDSDCSEDYQIERAVEIIDKWQATGEK